MARALAGYAVLVMGATLAASEFTVDEHGLPTLYYPQADLLYEHNASLDGTHFFADNDLHKFLPLASDITTARGVPVISFSAGHDASIAVSVHGRVQCVLELERLFGVRHFRTPNASSWLLALNVVRENCDSDSGGFPSEFAYGLLVNFHKPGEEALQFREFQQVIESEISVEKWRFVDHHMAHALVGYYTSPFHSALVVSYDGGGNDGMFNVYLGVGTSIRRIGKVNLNMGLAYNRIGGILPEVSHASLADICSDPLTTSRYPPSADSITMAGKLMGYAAAGVARDPDLSRLSRAFIQKFAADDAAAEDMLAQMIGFACQGQENQRELAATFQAQWEALAHEVVVEWLEKVLGALYQPLEGVVLSGGCALNVLANQRIYDWLRGVAGPWGPLGFHVPPAQGDEGLVVGALFALLPPLVRQPLQYAGFRLFDERDLDAEALARGARRLSSLGGIEHLADLLVGHRPCHEANCTAEKPIIAIVRGRQEYGPRALGHRSLIAVPDSEWMRDRLNRLKAREWYRPVAPMIADEALDEVFGHEVRSPYMTMAPPVKESVRRQFPALVHLDGTARHQSVGKNDEPWLHKLLHAVGKRTGLPALINTSFNSKGKPITNTIRECLSMLDTLEDLDYLLVEDWLFTKA